MGTHSPGRYRRKGREAFVPGEPNPESYFDYPKKSWWYKHHLEDFLEGWEEAKRKHEMDEREIKYMLAKGEDEFEIWWSDLNEETQKNLKEEGFWHENIESSPLAIICRPED